MVLWTYGDPGGYPRIYQASDTVYTAGVDCSGFVQQAANYSGNSYTATDLTTRQVWQNSGTLAYAKMNTTAFVSHSNVIDINQLVPGDILLYSGHHVVIVQDIEFTGDIREVKEKNVTVIEATKGSEDLYVWKVIKTRRWGSFKKYNYYIPRRLTTN